MESVITQIKSRRDVKTGLLHKLADIAREEGDQEQAELYANHAKNVKLYATQQELEALVSAETKAVTEEVKAKEGVTELTHETFERIINAHQVDLLVMFYSSSSTKYAHEVLDKLGEEYKSNPDLIIAKMNINNIDISGYPREVPGLHLWRCGGHKQSSYYYSGPFVLDNVVRFLHQNGID
jgi:hypothetical protein